MRYGIICPECGKAAFMLRPYLRLEDIQKKKLRMSHFVVPHPHAEWRCQNCSEPLDRKLFDVKAIVSL